MSSNPAITSKLEEMKQIQSRIDSIQIKSEFKLGEKLTYITAEALFQAGELRIMHDIAEGEFRLLLIQESPPINDKPLTWKNYIQIKNKELEEHRELQRQEGFTLTDFKFDGQ